MDCEEEERIELKLMVCGCYWKIGSIKGSLYFSVFNANETDEIVWQNFNKQKCRFQKILFLSLPCHDMKIPWKMCQ